ncbi:hypothetical protein [Streptomyces inhibens]|uniref:hypothetical protein n=1 Tax=Streptomyces inhibens TaxID=2293571 RepID=UPI0015F25008|nr:hypothetical protein [Streptomyces inhibens]
MTDLAMDSADLVHHLLVDHAVKGIIVVVALAVLALGMTVIWRRAGHTKDRPDEAGG